ncbi:Ig-like domain repeat protein [Streptomyces sp. NPDC046203]|uniref:RCC1 domain-containing protein n=1 Tax=Streptomyces sp. NPDC046203 TaxID=3154602 RepID=UPI0033E71581
MTLPSSATRSRTGGGGRARTLLRTTLRTLTTALFAALFLAGLTGLTGLAAPPASAASATDPTAVAWGDNDFGRLGDGTTTSSNVPVPVDLPAGVQLVALSGGNTFTLGLTSDNRVLSWGDNEYGQLGDGTTTNRSVPGPVDFPAGTHIKAIAAGHFHNLALTTDNHLFAWGWNREGQVGDGTTIDRHTPVPVDLPAGTEIKAIAARGNHSLALTTDGRVLAWGLNSTGQLGNGAANFAPNPTPVQTLIPAGTDIVAIVAGGYYSLALTSDGHVLGWGSNAWGQVGDGTTTDRHAPVPVDLPAGTEIAALSAGTGHSVALTTDGHVLTWGINIWGQLGDGTTVFNRPTPGGTALPAGLRFTAIAAGGYHTLALTSAGRVYAWGLDGSGQVGDGSTDLTQRNTPVRTLLPAGTHATFIAAGGWHSLALVTASTSTTTLTASPTTALPGEEVTLTAHVTCNTGTATGDVVFYDGTDPIGTAPLDANGDAALTTTSLPAGDRTITARYAGDEDCPASVSEPVTVTIQGPPVPVGALHLTKHATSAGPFGVGDTVDYTYTVTNTGDLALSPVTVTDDRVADVDCEATVLAPGESTTCRGTYTVTEADAVCGPRGSGGNGRGDNGRGNGGYGDHGTTCPVTNTATATALGVEGETITSNTATATIQVTSGGNGDHDGYGSAYGNGRKKEAKTA